MASPVLEHMFVLTVYHKAAVKSTPDANICSFIFKTVYKKSPEPDRYFQLRACKSLYFI